MNAPSGTRHHQPRTAEEQKRHDAVIQECLADDKRRLPAPLFAFVEAHEYDLAQDRTQAVYSCRMEDSGMIDDGEEERLDFINSAISWAEWVQDFGDYETREEFHHGTPEEWAFEVKKSNEWISLLKEWRATL